MGRTAAVVEVASKSTPGKTYRVWVGEDGPIFCECPAHKFARGGNRPPCKHMRDLGASDLLTTATAVAGGRVTLRADGPGTGIRSADHRFRLLEVQEENDDGAWVAVADLRRFTNLEVD